MKNAETASRLLDEAQILIQERGYNAVSYKDLAERVGIRTASIHYHFRAKADLGNSLMDRYLLNLQQALQTIDASKSSTTEKLRKFIDLYRTTETRGVICLCGSLASDQETLPPPLQERISKYLDYSEQWIAEKVAAGKERGEFAFVGDARDAATILLSGLQGGLILSRARCGSPHLDAVERMFLQTIGATLPTV